MLQPPAPDAFPAAAPHAVPAYSRSRWPASLTRWWRAVFERNAYGHQAHAGTSGTGGHHFFQHLSDRPRADAAAAATGSDSARPGPH